MRLPMKHSSLLADVGWFNHKKEVPNKIEVVEHKTKKVKLSVALSVPICYGEA